MPQQTKMPTKNIITNALFLSAIIVVSNYTVQFQIPNTPLTFGALTYPFSFLVLDILSEKYKRKDSSKVLMIALLLAFYPSYLAATPQIALASILAFCVSQPLDLILFYSLKSIMPRIWQLRNLGSTLIAQFIDTLIFFTVAFWGINTMSETLTMSLADYSVKALIALANTPLFWFFAIATFRKNRL